MPGYQTLAVVRGWVKAGLGNCSNDVANDAVNTIREHLYSWYTDVPLFLDAVQCFRLQKFCTDCNTCSDHYHGFTLPRDFQTIEAMWWNDGPIQLRNSWREYHTGISPECACDIEKIDMPGRYPTALDLKVRSPKRIKAIAVRNDDTGKKIKVRGKNAAGGQVEFELLLSTAGTLSDEAMQSIDMHGGIIKDVTLGRVVLATEDSDLLATYEADETVPAYRRVKITGTLGSYDCVNVRAARQFYPITDDDDIVETDQRQVFDSMARYLRLYQKHDKTTEDLRAEKDHYATAKGLMLGQVSRDLGKATVTEVAMPLPAALCRSGLMRNRGFRM